MRGEEYMNKLEGKIALITGGNSGIGFATAKQFVKEGAYVFITGRREPELAAAVKEIGRNVTGVQGDVANLAKASPDWPALKGACASAILGFVTLRPTAGHRLGLSAHDREVRGKGRAWQ